MSLRATFRIRWQARALGVAVLLLVAGAVAAIVSEDASPWSWAILSIIGAAALLATLSNFGDVVEVDESGLTHENVLLSRLGARRLRRAEWKDVLSAVDQDGVTFFVDIQHQGRWVLDQLDDHEHFRLILQDRGVTVTTRTRPRLAFWRRDHVEPR